MWALQGAMLPISCTSLLKSLDVSRFVTSTNHMIHSYIIPLVYRVNLRTNKVVYKSALKSIKYNTSILFFIFINLFLERGKGGRKSERNIDM